jgi:acetyltransferase
MSTYRLDRLFLPHSLAVVGASPHALSVGRHIIRNIIAAGFAGPVHVVNPHYSEIEGTGYGRFAVRPYPKQWEQRISFGAGAAAFVRPLRPEDEPRLHRLLEQVNAEDLRLRFFAPVKDFSHVFLARLTQLDYGRAIAFAAFDIATNQLIGVVHLHADSNYESGEYAILVRSDLKGHGLGWKLMELMIRYGRNEGLKRIGGQVLAENVTMLQMCRDLGFRITTDLDDSTIKVVALELE